MVTVDSVLMKTQNFWVQEFSNLSPSCIQIGRSFVKPSATLAIRFLLVGIKPTKKQPSKVPPNLPVYLFFAISIPILLLE